MIDALAALPHYWAHIQPVWDELGRMGLAGASYGVRRDEPWHRPDGPLSSRPGPFLVASFVDAQRLPSRPLVLLEHGAGQHYRGAGDLGSYAGGKGWDRAVLFLAPGRAPADRWRAAYPGIPVEEVGCPKLDGWTRSTTSQLPAGTKLGVGAPPTVVVTFHWPNPYCPEAGTALSHYAAWLPELARWAEGAGVCLIGHAHPRIWPNMRRRWASIGVESEEDLGHAVARADCLVADNTSAIYEAAALGIPVVALNAPWWRRQVHHGLRFWSEVPGPQADEPAEVIPLIAAALERPDEWAAERDRVTRHVYAYRDGSSARRAAEAIAEVVASLA